MIFQDCGGTLNPIRKIGSQFVEYICTHSKVSKDEAWKKGVSMLEKMRPLMKRKAVSDGKAEVSCHPLHGHS